MLLDVAAALYSPRKNVRRNEQKAEQTTIANNEKARSKLEQLRCAINKLTAIFFDFCLLFFFM